MATRKRKAAARRNIKKAAAAPAPADHHAVAEQDAHRARQGRRQGGPAEAAEALIARGKMPPVVHTGRSGG